MRRKILALIFACQAALLWGLRPGTTHAEPAADAPAAAIEPATAEPESTEPVVLQSGRLAPAEDDSPAATNSNLVRMAKDYDLWIDLKRKLVIVDGHVCLREGQLEMFACPRGTKEHESVVAVNCQAQFVHAALLAVGAKPGSPVQFHPEYTPASGTVVEILVLWVDEQGRRHKQRAQEWVQNVRTEKPMAYDWVFAGSGFWTDEDDGQRYYYADGGDFICVSNFATAMLDVPVQSSQDSGDLLFAAFTDRIPPLGTKVRLVLIPRLEAAAKPGEAPAENAVPAKR